MRSILLCKEGVRETKGKAAAKKVNNRWQTSSFKE
jgi:hypothetical protein